MSTQSTATDTENPSGESGSSVYAELLGASSLAELDEKPWDVKLALLQHHLELARIFVGELLEEEVEEKAGKRYKHDDSRYSRWEESGKRPNRRGEGPDRRAAHAR